MGTLILYPTAVSQWHALLNEAQADTQAMLPEDMESYLVFLLMRFVKQYGLVESVLALDLLEALSAPSTRKHTEQLQAVGDKSLLFCGLFPGMAERRHVRLEYFAAMGQQAYLSLSRAFDSPNAPLFEKLAEQFSTLQTVLRAIGKHPAVELPRAVDLSHHH